MSGRYVRSMPSSPRQELADLLRDAGAGGSFSTRRTAPPGDLTIDVTGLGTILLPVTAAQAKQLRLLGRPARYGKGEDTLVDLRVRDTWEVPRSRVKVDKRRWANTLRPILGSVRDDLGLPETSSLTAELHSMLVYEPGQFFAAHQDSEKSDQMIGTLIVVLPSRSEGGEIVVEHQGRSVTYTGSASSLTFVAFYADTRHEVLPVTRGYRVALTYNLILTGSSTPKPASTPTQNEGASALLRRHFEEPSEARWRGDREALQPPDRLVFLLDHQYSEHSLRWTQLKGDDAIRADALRHAAESADCETALALVEIQETWDCAEPAPRHRRRWWTDDESDDDVDDDDLDDDDHELGELLETTVTITSVHEKAHRFAPYVPSADLAAATPTSSLAPYDTEYTGNMGNWGNTMDRWYRRASVVVWPRTRSFALTCKADPNGAAEELRAAIADRPHDPHVPNDMVATLLRFWPDAVRRGRQRTLLPGALALAAELRDANSAAGLLEAFEISAVTPADAAALLIVNAEYGRRWFDDRITAWMTNRVPFGSEPTASREVWTEALPDLCRGLSKSKGQRSSTDAEPARTIVALTWNWLDAAIVAATAITRPSARHERMNELSRALLALLQATDIAGDPTVRDQIVTTVCEREFRLVPLLLHVIDASTAIPPNRRTRLGLTSIATHCGEALRAELARPGRTPGDWSITSFVSSDDCQDCTELSAFLEDTTAQQRVWPLAKARRQHIHRCIDEAELPVSHRTTHEGSPHKLVITKTTDLFTREADQRTKARASLTSVERLHRPSGPTTTRNR